MPSRHSDIGFPRTASPHREHVEHWKRCFSASRLLAAFYLVGPFSTLGLEEELESGLRSSKTLSRSSVTWGSSHSRAVSNLRFMCGATLLDSLRAWSILCRHRRPTRPRRGNYELGFFSQQQIDRDCLKRRNYHRLGCRAGDDRARMGGPPR